MTAPDEASSGGLTDYQYRLFSVVCGLAGFDGRLQTAVGELRVLTGGVHERTVRRGLQALSKRGLITREYSRRANGFRGKDIIHVVGSTLQGVGANVHQVVGTNVHKGVGANVRTSHDYRSRSKIVNGRIANSNNSNNSNQIKDIGNTSVSMKEVLLDMRYSVDDGDDLAGVGLTEKRESSKPPLPKNNPKNRGRRPEHEWTSMDVAAEFSFRVGKKYPLLPGTVNVRQLSAALAKFRNQYQTTALIELELLHLFMADERNFKDIGDEAPHLYKMYLASFGKKMNQARTNLGLNRVALIETSVVKLGTLVASDGRVFQNSMAGRTQLERHENRLKEASNG